MFRMKNVRTILEDWMVAVAFAEAGEHETAREFMRSNKRTGKKKRMDKKIPKEADNRLRLEL